MLTRCALLAAFLTAVPAAAQSYDENPSGRSLYALADFRLTAADGERAWLDEGFGKARFGGAPDGDSRVRPRAVEGDLVWQPQLGWSLGATVAAIAQHGQDHTVDLSEAYVSYRHAPFGAVRLSARAGLMWPPVSLEHGGPAWSVTDTITPSAINSWIGEEVKLVAAEATASVPLAGGRLTATAAAFGWNDTAGTLLAFRGWALHDQKATGFGLQPLPPLDAFMQYAQAPRTRPVIELDDRVGFYGKLSWSSSAVTLAAFYYDNRGDPEAVDSDLQWGWRTRFANVSARVALGPHLTLKAQGMTGSTLMGFPQPDRLWVDTKFRSAFLLATRRFGDAGVSGRIEAFGTRGHGSVLGAETSEDGWAVTAATRYTVNTHVELLAELLHIASTRADRRRVGLAPHQRQTVGQLSARLTL